SHNVRPNPRPPAPRESELESPAPISGVTVSAWSLDPKRRRRYLQIGFGIAALIVAIVVLFLLRGFLGAFALGSASASLIQPAVRRLHAAGVPRVPAILLVFIAVILGLTALTTVLQVVLMFIVAFLLALEAPVVRRDLRRFVPNDYRTDFDQIWRRVRKMLYAYVRGQILIAALIGICSGLACW